MKKFIQKTVCFGLPILLLLIGVECYIRNSPNSFVTKANYFQKNIASFEVLILGSSHNDCALNPRFFKLNTMNLSYGSQDIQLDSALFFHNVKKMKSLKKVIFELDYHYLDMQREKSYYKYPWYNLYYGVNIYPINDFSKFSFYFSNPKLFNKLFLEKWKTNYKEPIINKYGFEEVQNSNEFSEMNYDPIAIEKTAQKRLEYRQHKEISEINFKNNTRRITAIIKYCKQNNIEIYFDSTPMYKTYIENQLLYKKKRVEKFIKYIISKYKVHYYNFEKSKRFKVNDFNNDNHLNAKGAEKFSIIVDSIINNNQNKHFLK